MKFQHKKETVKDAFDQIRMLWMKEALLQDHYFTKYALFVNLAEFETSNFEKELNNLITTVIDTDSLIISGKQYTNEIFTKEYQIEIFGNSFGLHPSPTFYGGTVENIEKLSNAWEAVYMLNDKFSEHDIDYLAPALLSSNIKYRILEH